MYLRSVELVNWRSYRSVRFEFPRPHGNRNVVLVMAPNEYGKTSFFEAVTLGLFGRDGLLLVPRARVAAGNKTEDRLTESYSGFLKGVLHRRAAEDGPPECFVKLDWEDESSNPIEIKRTWYFRASDGTHKVADDQLLIYEGLERTPVAPPPTVSNKDQWYREWIAQHFLQPDLAEFFLFDGEQVQRFADREMSSQVRKGIEGLLGLPILRRLKESLAAYAQNRRTSAAAPSDNTVNAVKSDIENLESRIGKMTAKRNEVDAQLPSLQIEIDKLTRDLGGRGEGTVALIKNLLEDEQRHEAEARRAINDLMDLISGDIALAIAGTPLRECTIVRLKAEETRESWEAGHSQSNRNLNRFATDLAERIGRLEPPIGVDHKEAVVEAAIAAWEALWRQPDDCADDYLHAALTGPTRAAAINYLRAVDRHSAEEASNHVQRFDAASTTAEMKKRERLELQRIGPEVEEQAQRLKDFSERRGKLVEQRAAAQRDIDAATAELGNKRAEMERYMSRKAKQAPTLSYAKQADAYARLIDDLLRESVPFEVNEVAGEMSKAWKAMAHMSDRVERIEISPDCAVKMLAADGSDLHQIDKSAGASQVFTQALIAAVTKVSGRIFPFVVDTPLARLSLEQRLGVLKTFTDRTGQVILLSTDQEVVGDKLDAIRDRIIASYRLMVTHDRGVAVTTVQDLDPESV